MGPPDERRHSRLGRPTARQLTDPAAPSPGTGRTLVLWLNQARPPRGSLLYRPGRQHHRKPSIDTTPSAIANRNKQLCPRSTATASAANLQQTLSLRLKCRSARRRASTPPPCPASAVLVSPIDHLHLLDRDQVGGFTIGCGLGAASEASAGMWSVVLPTGLALLVFAMGLADEHAP